MWFEIMTGSEGRYYQVVVVLSNFIVLISLNIVVDIATLSVFFFRFTHTFTFTKKGYGRDKTEKNVDIAIRCLCFFSFLRTFIKKVP